MFGLKSKDKKRHSVCKNCECWAVSESGKDGTCRARAPMAVPHSPIAGDFTLVLPKTLPEDYCIHDYLEPVPDDIQRHV